MAEKQAKLEKLKNLYEKRRERITQRKEEQSIKKLQESNRDKPVSAKEKCASEKPIKALMKNESERCRDDL